MVRFLIGTQSLKSENSIHCVEYDEESVMVNKFVYPHPVGEIWQTHAHPNKGDLVATVHHRFGTILPISLLTMFKQPIICFSDGVKHRMGASIFRMSPVPEPGQSIDQLDASPSQLNVLASLDGMDSSEVSQLLWQPNEGSRIASISTDSRLDLWDLQSSGQVQVGYNRT